MSYLSRAAFFCFLFGLILIPLPPDCSAQEKIDVNSASLEDLTKIIHIGEVRAKELISLRPFSSLDDLARIKGISEARVQDIKEQGLAFVKDAKSPVKEADVLENPDSSALAEKDSEWTKEQTPAREEIEDNGNNLKKNKINYSLISIPLALVSAGSVLLLKNNVKIK
jgi:hypothetical protein